MVGGTPWVLVTNLQAGYAGVFALAAVLCLVCLVRTRVIPEGDIRRGLAALVALSAAWGALAAVRLLVTGVSLQQGLYIAELLVGFGTVFAWLYFVSAYAGRRYHRDRRLRALAALVYVSVAALKLTNPIHGAYFTAEQLAAPFPHLAVTQAPVHWVVAGLAYSGSVAGFLLLYDTFSRSRYGTKRLVALSVVAMLPIVADAVALTDPGIPEVNFESVGVAAFAVGVLFFVEDDFLQARVTGRRALLREHPDPTLVLDEVGRLLDFNAAADTLFGGLETRGALADQAPPLAAALEDGGRVELGDREFDLWTQPVSVRGGRTATTVVLRDVTEMVAQRREIERQNRQLEAIADAVAHNLRNASNVLLGHVRLAVDESSGTAGESLAVAERTSERIAAVAEDLRLLADLGRTVTETTPLALTAAAEEGWEAVDPGNATLHCEDGTIRADSRRLTVLLREVFRFQLATGASAVRVEPVTDAAGMSAPTPDAAAGTERGAGKPAATEAADIKADGATGHGFVVVGDGERVPADETPDLLRFDAESSVNTPGLGLAVAGALAAAHGWEASVEDGGRRFVVRTREPGAS